MTAKEDNLATFNSGIEQGLEINVSAWKCLKNQSEEDAQKEKDFDIDKAIIAVVKCAREHYRNGTLVCVFNSKYTPKGSYEGVEFRTYNAPLSYVSCYIKDLQLANDPTP